MAHTTHDLSGEKGTAASEATADSVAWQEHEHKSELTHSHARQLIESTGSPELAKHAVELAAENQQSESAAVPAGHKSDGAASASASQAELAALLGYASYLDLFEASKPVGGDQRWHWLITVDSDGKWALWNDDDFEIVGRFDAQEAAAGAALSSTRRKAK